MQEVINSLYSRINRVSEIFTKANTDMDYVRTNGFWTGTTSDTVYEKYDQLKSNYDSIISSLTTLNDFVDNIKESYISWDNYMKQKAEELDIDI
jgi:uncharacterized protein YukE